MKSLRFFWLALFVLFIGVASYLAEEVFLPTRPFPKGSLEAQIHDDLRKLNESRMLPKEFGSLHEVFIRDQRLQKTNLDWPALASRQFPRDPAGKYDLQIEIFDAEGTSKDPKVNPQIVQFSLFDKDSKNKVWELSREYNPPSN